MSKSCVNCGRDIYDSAVACPFCGHIAQADEATQQEMIDTEMKGVHCD